MTIALDTTHTYDPGHNQATEDSDEVKVIRFTPDILEKTMIIVCQYGNTVESVWIPGNAPCIEICVMNHPELLHPVDPEQSIDADPQYDTMMATAKLTAAEISALALLDPVPDVYTYGLVSKGMYEWLVNKGHFLGTANP
jgi:hypothetical protein